MTKKMIEREIDIIRNECYVFMPDNFDRMKMINTALDDVLDFAEMIINAMKNDKDEMIISMMNSEYKENFKKVWGCDAE